MTLIDVLRHLSLVVWTVVLIAMARPIWRIARRQSRYYDVLLALLGFVALMVIGFNLRPLIAANSTAAYAGLYVISIALGLRILFVTRAYEQARHD